MMTLPYASKRLCHYDRASIFSHGTKTAIVPWSHYRGDHSDKPHLLGPLWMSDQPDAEISK
jgi:hypothetical protein